MRTPGGHHPDFCRVCRIVRNERIERRKNRALALLGLVVLPFLLLLDLVEAIVRVHVEACIEWHSFARRLIRVLRTGNL